MELIDTVADKVAVPDRRALAHSGRISRFLRDMYGTLLDEVPLRAWNRVLTVDCRDGWVSEEAWRRLGRGYVCGIDSSPAMVRVASDLREVPGQLEFRTWDGEKLPFPDESFDVVLWVFGIHRCPRPLQVLREVHRVLRSSGDAYLLEADRAGFGGLYAVWDYVYRLLDDGHVRYYTGGELGELLESAGFVEARTIKRYQGILRGGKIFASAVTLRARRHFV